VEQKDSLTENAQFALIAELARRHVDVPVVLPQDASQPMDDELEQPSSHLFWLGLFLLDTFLVYLCATCISPLLVGKLFASIVPSLESHSRTSPTNWYLQHLAMATIVPALVAGYFDVGRLLPVLFARQPATWRSGSAAIQAWIIPTAVLLWGVLTFHASSSSVLYRSSTSAFQHYFDTQQVVPTFSTPLIADPRRMLGQMFVTAPFYAGVAFSLGALVWHHQLLSKLFKRLFSPSPTPPPSP